MNTKPNWPGIRLAYLNQEGSLKALSQRFGVPLRSLERRCSRENWRQHAQRVGGDVAAMAAELAGTEAREIAAKLNLPERSAALRGRVITELERDADLVADTPPKSLEHSQQRQNVLSTLTRTAETVLQWNDKRPEPAVRINILGAMIVSDNPQPAHSPSAALPDSNVDHMEHGQNDGELKLESPSEREP